MTADSPSQAHPPTFLMWCGIYASAHAANKVHLVCWACFSVAPGTSRTMTLATTTSPRAVHKTVRVRTFTRLENQNWDLREVGC